MPLCPPRFSGEDLRATAMATAAAEGAAVHAVTG